MKQLFMSKLKKLKKNYSKNKKKNKDKSINWIEKGEIKKDKNFKNKKKKIKEIQKREKMEIRLHRKLNWKLELNLKVDHVNFKIVKN